MLLKIDQKWAFTAEFGLTKEQINPMLFKYSNIGEGGKLSKSFEEASSLSLVPKSDTDKENCN